MLCLLIQQTNNKPEKFIVWLSLTQQQPNFKATHFTGELIGNKCLYTHFELYSIGKIGAKHVMTKLRVIN